MRPPCPDRDVRLVDFEAVAMAAAIAIMVLIVSVITLAIANREAKDSTELSVLAGAGVWMIIVNIKDLDRADIRRFHQSYRVGGGCCELDRKGKVERYGFGLRLLRDLHRVCPTGALMPLIEWRIPTAGSWDFASLSK